MVKKCKLGKKIFLISLIILLIIVGIIGFILPLVPGIPFLLIAFLLSLFFLPKRMKKGKFMKKLLKLRHRWSKDNVQMKFFTFFSLNTFIVLLITAFLLGNYEFLYYGILLVPLIFVVYFIHKRIRLHFPVFVLVVLFFIMHMLGGLIHLEGVRLYEFSWHMFHYEYLIHFIGSFVIVFVVYNLLHKEFSLKDKWGTLYAMFLLITVTLGFGVIAEFVEYSSAVMFDAPAAAKDYFNNGLDLVLNLFGTVIATILVLFYHKKKVFNKLIDGKTGELFRDLPE